MPTVYFSRSAHENTRWKLAPLNSGHGLIKAARLIDDKSFRHYYCATVLHNAFIAVMMGDKFHDYS